MTYGIGPKSVLRQASDFMEYVVSMGLANGENVPILRSSREATEVTFSKAHFVSVALKDQGYQDVHDELLDRKAYNFKMVDNALIQMMYKFGIEGLVKHRLAFFPSPILVDFEIHPDSYLHEERWLHVARRRTVPCPIRFDYDLTAARLDSAHPKSHLTIGQYESCRIPVSAPLMPRMFADFVLRHFYGASVADGLPHSRIHFPASISMDERKMIHLEVPE